jgi:Membrane bound FAD containing D-sorbitol dehydrogenase
MIAPTRRDLILAAVGAAIAAAGSTGFPAALYAQSTVTPEQFLAISERLTGKTDLDLDIAATLLGGFLATGHEEALAQFANETFDSFTPVADAIVAAWYSGIVDTVEDGKPAQKLATFTEALVWDAMTYSKPFAECGGETGYWADPPEA